MSRNGANAGGAAFLHSPMISAVAGLSSLVSGPGRPPGLALRVPPAGDVNSGRNVGGSAGSSALDFVHRQQPPSLLPPPPPLTATTTTPTTMITLAQPRPDAARRQNEYFDAPPLRSPTALLPPPPPPAATAILAQLPTTVAPVATPSPLPSPLPHAIGVSGASVGNDGVVVLREPKRSPPTAGVYGGAGDNCCCCCSCGSCCNDDSAASVKTVSDDNCHNSRKLKQECVQRRPTVSSQPDTESCCAKGAAENWRNSLAKGTADCQACRHQRQTCCCKTSNNNNSITANGIKNANSSHNGSRSGCTVGGGCTANTSTSPGALNADVAFAGSGNPPPASPESTAHAHWWPLPPPLSTAAPSAADCHRRCHDQSAHHHPNQHHYHEHDQHHPRSQGPHHLRLDHRHECVCGRAQPASRHRYSDHQHHHQCRQHHRDQVQFGRETHVNGRRRVACKNGGGGVTSVSNCAADRDSVKPIAAAASSECAGGGKSRLLPLPPLANLNESTATTTSIVCRTCGKCRCEACGQPRRLPSRWLCADKFHCSAPNVVEHVTCVCCARAIFHRWSTQNTAQRRQRRRQSAAQLPPALQTPAHASVVGAAVVAAAAAAAYDGRNVPAYGARSHHDDSAAGPHHHYRDCDYAVDDVDDDDNYDDDDGADCCGGDDTPSCDADSPCACGPPRCAARWMCLTALGVVLPCMCCYPPLRACVALCEAIYGRWTSRRGCRCDPTSPRPARLHDTVAAAGHGVSRGRCNSLAFANSGANNNDSKHNYNIDSLDGVKKSQLYGSGSSAAAAGNGKSGTLTLPIAAGGDAPNKGSSWCS